MTEEHLWHRLFPALHRGSGGSCSQPSSRSQRSRVGAPPHTAPGCLPAGGSKQTHIVGCTRSSRLTKTCLLSSIGSSCCVLLQLKFLFNKGLNYVLYKMKNELSDIFLFLRIKTFKCTKSGLF